MQNLRVTIVQPDIIWENPEANREKYSKFIEDVGETDIIIFPEMFTSGFSMNPGELKEPMNGKTISWMQKIASDKNCSVVGSLIVEEKGKVYNRAVWVFPDGKTEKYDKRHLFTMGQEHNHYSAGKEKNIVKYKDWRLCPMICYDLRFPVWNRNMENYDVIIFMANWPSPRHYHWKSLLIARAIENQSYCFGVNRVGTDGVGLSYLGDSGLITFNGITDFMGENEHIKTFEISLSELQQYRKSFPFLEDRDTFQIK